MRRDLFRHLTGHSPSYFAERMPGTLTSRVTATSNAVFTGERGAAIAAMAEAFEVWIRRHEPVGGLISVEPHKPSNEFEEIAASDGWPTMPNCTTWPG